MTCFTARPKQGTACLKVRLAMHFAVVLYITMSIFFLMLTYHQFTTDMKMFFFFFKDLKYFDNFFGSRITQNAYPIRKTLKLKKNYLTL